MKETNLTRNHSTAVQRGWTSPGASSTLGPLPVELTNDSGVNLVEGDPVVVLSDGTIARTTTARDTRPVGVCLDDIDDGEDGMVQFEGPVDLINVTASVTAGHYAETSTTGGQATANATRQSGSFAVFTSGGTTPSGFLFGGAPDLAAADPLTGADLIALGVVGPILIADDHSTPIVFGDLLLTEAGDDFLYADIGA